MRAWRRLDKKMSARTDRLIPLLVSSKERNMLFSFIYSFTHLTLLVSTSVTMQRMHHLQCCQTISPALTNVLQSCYHGDHLSCKLKFLYEVHIALMLIRTLWLGVHMCRGGEVMLSEDWIILCAYSSEPT